MITLHSYLYIYTIAVVIMALLVIFKSSLFNELSTRISVIIVASGPIAQVLISMADELIVARGSQNPKLVFPVDALVLLGSPVVLGLIAARFVRRPLRQFSETIAALEQSNYKIQLPPTGIREFDEVFTKFNNLINRLQHEEKFRKDLISDTSHELNTPLAIMIGQLTAVQEGKLSMTQERVAILKEQAERLTELVQQLNAYTKARMPDTGAPEDIHLAQFCQEFITHFALELKHKGITAKLHIAEEYTIYINRGVLQRIFTNLIQNTLRYSQATEVIIEATANELVFSDNGKGVPPKSLPYLFERFYRVEKSRNRATGGLGLGLAIVRELAESQGWTINAVAGQPGLTLILKLKP